MKKDIILSIMVSSVAVAGTTPTVYAADTSNAVIIADKIAVKKPASSGKCASGKCGTEKIYAQAKLKQDPQDQLVRARDGKCGLTGEGLKTPGTPQQVNDTKMVNGVCGK
ncbi:hypothetical protein QNZ44_004532 [Enterobacter kobei]